VVWNREWQFFVWERAFRPSEPKRRSATAWVHSNSVFVRERMLYADRSVRATRKRDENLL